MEERLVPGTDTFEAFATNAKSSTATSEMDPQMEPVSLKFLLTSVEHFYCPRTHKMAKMGSAAFVVNRC